MTAIPRSVAMPISRIRRVSVSSSNAGAGTDRPTEALGPMPFARNKDHQPRASTVIN
jgi:hypothetical protein